MLLIHYPSMPRFSTHGSLGVHRGGINGDGGQEGMDRVKFMDVDKIADVVKDVDADKIVDVVKDMEGRLELLSKAREESLVELVVQDWRGVHRKKGS